MKLLTLREDLNVKGHGMAWMQNDGMVAGTTWPGKFPSF